MYGYIASRSGKARADRYTERILAACEALGTFPQRGQDLGDLKPGLRSIGFERRVTIVSQVTPQVVVVQGVFYGGQDWPTKLS